MNHSIGNLFQRLTWPRFVAFVALFLAVTLPKDAQAASAVWTNTLDGSWATDGNWSPSAAPGSNSGTTSSDVGTFSNVPTSARTVTVDANRNAGGITFSHTAGSSRGYTLSGGGLRLSNGGTILESAASGTHVDSIVTSIEIEGDGGSAMFTAGATVATVTLSIGGTVAGVSSAGNTTTLTLNGSNTGTNTVSGLVGDGILGGKLAVVKSGAGKWILNGSNSFTGDTVINQGMLQIGNAGVLGSLGTLSAITDNATLVFNRTDSITQGSDFNSVISGSGHVIQAGSGTLILNGVNTYTGNTKISAGKLVAVKAASLPGYSNAGSVSVIAAATLQLQPGDGAAGWSAAQIDSLLSAAGFANNTSALAFDTTQGDFAYGTVITNNIALVKTGANTLSLTSNANACTGGAAIKSGRLTLSGGDNRLATTGTITISGGTLDLGGNTQTITAGGVFFMGGSVQNGTFQSSMLYDGQSGTVSANLGGSGSLTKSGSGTLVLSGANSYSGLTRVSTGTVRMGHNNALGATNGTTTVSSGAVLDLNGKTSGESVTINGSGISNVGALINSDASNVATLTAGLVHPTASTIGGDGTIAIMGSLGNGAGNNGITLTKNGTGTLILMAASSRGNTSGTSILGGRIRMLVDNALSSGGAAITLNSGTATLELAMVGNDTQVINFNNGTLRSDGSLTQTAPITVGASAVGTFSTVGSSDTFTIGDGANDISGGSGATLHMGGPGTLALSQASNYAGNWILDSGIIKLGNATALGTGSLTFAGGTLQSATALTVTNNTFVAGVTATIDTVSNGLTLSGVIGGSGSLTKVGNGSLTLANVNSYPGATMINSGTLLLGSSGSIGSSSTITVGSAGWFNVSPVTGGFTLNSGQTVKGTGTIVGGVTIASGAHIAPGASIGTLNQTAGLALNEGSILDFEVGTTVNNNDKIILNDGGGTLTLIGTSTLNLYAEGGTSLWSPTVPGPYRLIKYGGSILGGGTFSMNYGTGTGYLFGLKTTGGWLTLGVAVDVPAYEWGGNNNDQWNTAANWIGGTGSPGAGPAAINFGTFSSSGTVDIGSTTATMTDIAFRNSQPTTIAGAGTLTLANSDTGVEVTVDNTHTISSSVNVVLGDNMNVTANSGCSLAIAGTITGSGYGIAKAGAGTLTLSGSNSYTGGTTMNAGVLAISADANLGGGSGTVTFGGGSLYLSSSATFSTARPVVISGGNGTVSFESGTRLTTGDGSSSCLTLGGNTLNLDGNGTLALNGGTVSSSGGTITIGSGSTLDASLFYGLVDFGGTITINGNGTLRTNRQTPGSDYFTSSGTITETRMKFGMTGGMVVFNGDVSGSEAAQLTGDWTGNRASWNIEAGKGVSLRHFTNGAYNNIQLDGLTGGGNLTRNNVSQFTMGLILGVNDTTGGGLTGTASFAGMLDFSGGTVHVFHVTKVGNGTQVFTGAFASDAEIVNTSQLRVDSGTIVAANQNAFSSMRFNSSGAGVLSFDGGTAFNLGAIYGSGNLLLQNLSGTGIGLSTGGDPSPSGNSFAGSMSGTGSLTKIGGNTLTLTGNNTYTGATTINAGTLLLGSFGALAGTSTITFTGGTLQFSAGNQQDYGAIIKNSTISAIKIDSNGQSITFAGAIDSSNTGGLIKSGAGILTLRGSNAYTGTTTISAGTLRIDGGGLLGGGTYSGNAVNNSALIYNGSNSQTFTGTISGNGSLTVSAGTLTVSGTNTYTGVTAVNGGTLWVNNTSGSGTGTNSVTVAAGGKVGGTGVIAGAVNVSAGGTLSPGADGVGVLTLTNALTLSADATFAITVSTNAALSSQCVVSNSAPINITGAKLKVSLAPGYMPTEGDTFILILNVSGGSGALTGTFSAVEVEKGGVPGDLAAPGGVVTYPGNGNVELTFRYESPGTIVIVK